MTAKPTSEDKLLEVIENPSAAKSKKLFSPRRNESSLKQADTWLRSLLSKEKLLALLNLQVINNVLIGICVCATLFLVFDFSHQSMKLERRFMEINTEKGKAVMTEKELPALMVNLQESLGLAKARNIFSLIPPKKEEPAPKGPPPVDYSARLKNLKIVGIIWSGRNSQVMIEDLQEKKTSLLKEGDIVDEFEIKSIQKDHVIFRRENKEWIVR